MCIEDECTRCKKGIKFTHSTKVHIIFTLCDSCNKKYSRKIVKEITSFINKLLQPDRLNKKTPKGDAIVETHR